MRIMAANHRLLELAFMLDLLDQSRIVRHRGQCNQQEHALRCATLAELDGCSLSEIVMCLIHDLAKPLSEVRHGEIMAEAMSDKLPAYLIEILQGHGEMVRAVARGELSDEDLSLAARFARWDFEAQMVAHPAFPLVHFLPMLREVMLNGTPEVNIQCLPLAPESQSSLRPS
jgi:predicted HD phosphohydrolase